MAKTLKDILEDYFTGEPFEMAKMHLVELLEDIDEAGGFVGGAWGPDDIMENLEVVYVIARDGQIVSDAYGSREAAVGSGLGPGEKIIRLFPGDPGYKEFMGFQK